MFINRKNDAYYISKTETPNNVWYPINLEIARYGEDYVKSKLGVTDPIQQRDLRIEFYEATRNTKILTDEVEYQTLRYNDMEYPIYLHNRTAESVTVFIEKGLFTLYPGEPNEMDHPPNGYAWNVITCTDTPEIIQEKLYDTEFEFGIAMCDKLREIMGW